MLKRNWTLPNIAATAVAAAVAACAMYQHCIWTLYTSADTGWIVQTGREILDHGLPQHDVFGAGNSSAAIVAYQWLSEVIAAWLFSFGSMWLVGLVACLSTALLVLFALPRAWTRLGIPVFIPLLCLSAVQTPNWFQARPQLFSYWLIFAFLSILERWRLEGKRWLLFMLPPLMVLWVNLHSFWFVGLFLLIVYLLCDWQRRRQPPTTALFSLAACLAATLLNPYGARLTGYLLSFIDGSQYMHIWEVLPAFSTAEGLWAIAFLPIAIVVLIKNRHTIPREAMFVVAAASLAAIFVRRFQPVAVLLMWPYLGAALAAIKWPALPARPKMLPATSLQALFALTVPVACWFAQMPTLSAAWMIYTEDSLPLLAAAQKLSAAQDKLLCDPTIGSWLIALRTLPVFVDTRFDIYPKRFLEQWMNCLEAKGDYNAYLQRVGATQLLLRDQAPLNQALMYSSEWQLVLHDGRFAWWMRDGDETYATMRHWSLTDELIRASGMPPWIITATVESRAARYLLLARVYRRHHLQPLAQMYIQRGLSLMPESKALHDEQQLCSRNDSKTY